MRERITSVIRVFFSPPNVCVRVSLVTLFRKKDVAAFGGEGDSWEIPFGGSRGRGDPLSLSLSLDRIFLPPSSSTDCHTESRWAAISPQIGIAGLNLLSLWFIASYISARGNRSLNGGPVCVCANKVAQ